MGKRSKKRPYRDPHVELNMDSLASMPRLVTLRSGDEYEVSRIGRALKSYTCPGCHRCIAPGISHVVAWPVHVAFWQDRGVEARRHWHESCWNRYVG